MRTSFSIRRLVKKEAVLVGDLFRVVYGEEYPAAYVYRPEELWAENEKGNTYSLLAFNEEHEPIAHLAMFRSAPNPKVYELGQLLVLPQHRGSGISDCLTQYVTEELDKNAGIEAVFVESVCNHAVSQKLVAKRGYVDTALELDLMPAEAYPQAQGGAGRVACILQFKEKGAQSRHIYLPACYQAELTGCYAGLPAREMQAVETFLPQEGETRGQQKIYDFAGVARITVENIGADFANYVSELEKLAQVKEIQAMQVYLPLNKPTIGGAVALLQEQGFFLGGVLPCWFGGDGLLMQKIRHKNPGFSAVKLYTEKAGKVLDLVKADWKKINMWGW